MSGKYNEDGSRKDVPRVSLPFQVIETINESRATREAEKHEGKTLFDFYQGKEGDTFEAGWKNKLIWGDNLLVMGSLLQKFAGEVDLIYIDRPSRLEQTSPSQPKSAMATLRSPRNSQSLRRKHIATLGVGEAPARIRRGYGEVPVGLPGTEGGMIMPPCFICSTRRSRIRNWRIPLRVPGRALFWPIFICVYPRPSVVCSIPGTGVDGLSCGVRLWARKRARDALALRTYDLRRTL